MHAKAGEWFPPNPAIAPASFATPWTRASLPIAGTCPFSTTPPQKTAGILKALGLDALIAAGIDDELSRDLSDGQIEVVLRDGGAVRDEFEDYLNCLMNGEEDDYLD